MSFIQKYSAGYSDSQHIYLSLLSLNLIIIFQVSPMDIKNLCKLYRTGKKYKYVFFWGHQSKQQQVTKSCFSQWYPAPFIVDGNRFASAEHFMMAEKARLFGDSEILQKLSMLRILGLQKPLDEKFVVLNKISGMQTDLILL